MQGLSVELKAQKRFACAAAMAAVFVLLAGGPDALANTVRCVPNLHVNSGCVAPAYPTISAAVAAASGQDVIVVGPGYYNETVAIAAPITLLGAQAGRDARVGRNNPAAESTVDASGSPIGSGDGAAFLVLAPNVVIDGFTIEGGTNGTTAYASGVFVSNTGPTTILNNIIQNNAIGAQAYQSNSQLVEHNFFQTNNVGQAGSADPYFAGATGWAVAVVDSQGNAISENKFNGNLASAVFIYGAAGTEVTRNTSTDDGSFAVFFASTNCYFSYNQGQDFGDQGFLNFAQPAAVDVALGNAGIQIIGNDLENGMNSNGIGFTTIFTVGPNVGSSCSSCEVTGNTIKGFARNGIAAQVAGGVGTLVGSGISGNDVEDNGNDGILLEEGSNSGNSLVDNKMQGNSVNDCEDDTYLLGGGAGTAGTYNTWFNNTGNSSSPLGLCAPLK